MRITPCVALGFVWFLGAHLSTYAQTPVLPSESDLARVGLTRAWYATVPAGGLQERVLAGTVAEDLVALQSNRATTFVLEVETGRLRAIVPGQATVHGRPAFAVNSQAFFTFKGAHLYRFNRATGIVDWREHVDQLPNTPMTANEEFVYFGTLRGRFYAIPTMPDVPGIRKWFVQLYTPLAAAPLAHGEYVVAGALDGIIHVFPTGSGRFRFRYRLDDRFRSDMVADQFTLYAASMGSFIYAIDIRNGDTMWRYTAGAPVSKPLLLARDADGKLDLFVLNDRGELLAMDAIEGTLKWRVVGVADVAAVSPQRVYAWDEFSRLKVLSRKDGATVASLALPGYTVHVWNRYSDRVVLASPNGLIVGLREAALKEPVYHIFPSTMREAEEEEGEQGEQAEGAGSPQG